MKRRPYPAWRNEWRGYLWFIDLMCAGALAAAVALVIAGIRWLIAR